MKFKTVPETIPNLDISISIYPILSQYPPSHKRGLQRRKTPKMAPESYSESV